MPRNFALTPNGEYMLQPRLVWPAVGSSERNGGAFFYKNEIGCIAPLVYCDPNPSVVRYVYRAPLTVLSVGGVFRWGIGYYDTDY